VAERMKKGELFSEQSYLTDSSFKKAIAYHTLKGRKVYSGGGIMPDIFVPADTTGNTQLVQDMNDQQLFGAYVIDRMQPVLKSFKSDEAFLKSYTVSNDEMDDFILYASRTIKQMDSAELKESKDNIKLLLKAYAARYKWGDTAYFEVLNSDDTTLKKAIAAIN
jgi:carboxyl-terminal processing protease